MPKEKVNPSIIGSWYTEVSWRREPADGAGKGHVQVATVNPYSPFEFPEKDAGDHFEPGERFDGWRLTFDRDGLNRLIRVLRKARDAAFGADA